ncbi:MAG: phospholipase D-like domain-containing protein [Pseudomonadota bacterium]
MPLFEPGRNCWKIAQADTFTLLVDGENFFRSVRAAMSQARKRIVLIGWDFDTRVRMYDTQGEVDGPLEIGEYVDWLVHQNPDLHVHILQWDLGALKLTKRAKTLVKVATWLPHPRVHFALDASHPTGAAQHEKLIVIDDDIAFCGGIDITEDRWDTRDHRDVEDKRTQPNDHDAGPWHDVSTRMTGPVAADLSRLAEQRWKNATGEDLSPTASSPEDARVPAQKSHTDQAGLQNVAVAIARTRGELDERPAIREIEALYCDIIGTAQDVIYIETQYFTSKRIAAALAARLRRDDSPEIILVTPQTADGWLESQIMDTTRSRLVEALRGIDTERRFHVYHPVTGGGSDIYVHAKVFIADDRFLRVGSSNLSNRSMGFDSECDVCVDAQQASDPERASVSIETCRNDLLAEHLGCDRKHLVQTVASEGSFAAAIAYHSISGRHLRPYEYPDLNLVQEWLTTNDILDPETSDTAWPSISLKDMPDRANLQFGNSNDPT